MRKNRSIAIFRLIFQGPDVNELFARFEQMDYNL